MADESSDLLYELGHAQGDELWNAVKRAGEERRTDAAPLLAAMLRKEDLGQYTTEIRATAAWSLARLGFDTVIERLGSAVDEDLPARVALADALGETRDPSAIPLLSTLMGDSHPEVVLWASLALSKIGEESVSTLVDAFRHQADHLDSSAYALDALKKIGTPRALSALDALVSEQPVKRQEELRAALAP